MKLLCIKENFKKSFINVMNIQKICSKSDQASLVPMSFNDVLCQNKTDNKCFILFHCAYFITRFVPLHVVQ